MSEISQEEKDKIIQALDARGASLPCPRCRNTKFVLAPGYFSNFVQEKQDAVTFGGANLPTVMVLCEKCGWVAHHALGALGLLQQSKEAERTNPPHEAPKAEGAK
jgi:hypothetical protein